MHHSVLPIVPTVIIRRNLDANVESVGLNGLVEESTSFWPVIQRGRNLCKADTCIKYANMKYLKHFWDRVKLLSEKNWSF